MVKVNLTYDTKKGKSTNIFDLPNELEIEVSVKNVFAMSVAVAKLFNVPPFYLFFETESGEFLSKKKHKDIIHTTNKFLYITLIPSIYSLDSVTQCFSFYFENSQKFIPFIRLSKQTSTQAYIKVLNNLFAPYTFDPKTFHDPLNPEEVLDLESYTKQKYPTLIIVSDTQPLSLFLLLENIAECIRYSLLGKYAMRDQFGIEDKNELYPSKLNISIADEMIPRVLRKYPGTEVWKYNEYWYGTKKMEK